MTTDRAQLAADLQRLWKLRPEMKPDGLNVDASGNWDDADGRLLPDHIGVPAGHVTKAVYPDGRHRWGPKYRGVVFRGFRHEIFVADPMNFGAILAIRTGPAEFSQRLVTRLREFGDRQEDGYVWRDGKVIAVPDERVYFELCQETWREPWERDRA